MNIEKQKEILIRNRIYPILDKINKQAITEMEKVLFQMVIEDQRKPITLVFDSGGGDVGSALNGYDLIISMPCEINAAVIGVCHSSAITLMSACKKRCASTHARFLFHAMTSELTIKVTEDIDEQLRRGAESLKISYDQVLKVQSAAFNLSREQLIEMRILGERYDVKLTAQQAKEKGVIHNVVKKFNFLRD